MGEKDGIQNGTIVYFKTAKFSPTGNKKKEFGFQGHGYGVFLGHVSPFVPAPPLDLVLATMGGIGFIRLEDLQEIVGPEKLGEILEKWREKYDNRIKAIAEAITKSREHILGPDGKPLLAPDKLEPKDT